MKLNNPIHIARMDGSESTEEWEEISFPGDKKDLVIAFDIETTGQYPTENDTLQIGISVVSPYPDCCILDSYLWSEYRPESPEKYEFEGRCNVEFWSKNPTLLSHISQLTDRTRTVEESREQGIVGFMLFCKKWETKCEENSIKLWKATDDKSFDSMFLNVMIERYIHKNPKYAGETFTNVLPYTASNPKQRNLIETNALQWGILLGLFGKKYIKKPPGQGDSFELEFDIKKGSEQITHDHQADHDAYYIGRQLQICLALARGEILLKSQR